MANLRANKITSTEVFETTGSVQFDGSGDYLSIANSGNDFKFGTADFTIEMWINPNTVNTSSQTDGLANIVDFDATVGFGSNAWFAIHQGNSTIVLAYSGANRITSTSFLTSNTWFHIAVVRYNGTFTIYANGVSVGSLTETKDFSDALSRSLFVGKQVISGNERNFNGHISNLRIIKGRALYTSNFTPPIRELEVIPNTVLLCCQSKTRANEEKTGKTITVNGNAVANELTPGLLTNIVKSGGSSAITGSVEFDGTGDYLSTPSSSDLDLGTGNFTLETWVYFGNTDDVNGKGVAIITNPAGSITTLYCSVSGGNTISFYNGSSIASGTFTVSSWNHFAVTRNGSTLYLFINGILAQSATHTSSISFSSSNIGTQLSNAGFLKGFISNLRVIKGRALYTSNFIPPTRKLTRVPGTVLLCCQDTKNPTQEATGKTITPYGSLDRQNVGVELVTNGGFDSGTTGWTISNASEGSITVTNGQLVISNNDTNDPPVYAYQGIVTKIGSTYRVSADIVGGTASSHAVYLSNTSLSSNSFAAFASADTNRFLIFTATASTTYIILRVNANEVATSIFDNVSAYKIDPGPKPPFVPQVGSDGSVEFKGPTKINTPNYFYLPTGPTEQRSRGRGVFGGGFTPTPAPGTRINTIEYITISSTGNAQDFGDLSASKQALSACSSSTRGVFGGGLTNIPAPAGTYFNTIEYITISSTGNVQDFGDLSVGKQALSACSSSTRGVFGGGYAVTPAATFLNVIEYITISSTGNVQDFGDLSVGKSNLSACSSSTRGVFGGGATATPALTYFNTIEYITISSTGNAQDFGDLSVSKYFLSSCSSSIRGIFGGGFTPTPATTYFNTIEYITISSTGNAQDFGDLSILNGNPSACSSSIRGIFGGGITSTPTVARVNTIEYITISSTGNTQDFGDLIEAKNVLNACSDSHGGLG